MKNLWNLLLNTHQAKNDKNQSAKEVIIEWWYPITQYLSELFNSSKTDTSQGNAISGIVRTVAANCTLIVVSSTEDANNAAGTASDNILLGAVQALCKYFLHFNKHNHSALFLAALDITLKQFIECRTFYRVENIEVCKCENKDTVGNRIPSVQELKIPNSGAAIEVFENVAENLSTTKHIQFEIYLYMPQQPASQWSCTDSERLQDHYYYLMDNVILTKWDHCNKSFEHHKW